MHYQSNRQLQERATSMSVADVLAAATHFFARQSGIYSAFVEKQGPGHVVMRGQGGEELVIAARQVEGSTVVTGSTYLFDQQIARFLDSLPAAPPSAPEPIPSPTVAAVPPTSSPTSPGAA